MGDVERSDGRRDAGRDAPLRVAVVHAGVSDPSSTGLLADRIAQRARELGRVEGAEVEVVTIALRDLLPELPGALGSGLLGPRFTAAVAEVARADGIVAAAPVYKAGASALFDAFFQVVDDDLVVAKPVALAATAGTPRHALVVDERMRSLFAYLRALTTPTSVFAAGDDWQDPSLATRIDRTARELLLLMRSGLERSIKADPKQTYARAFGSAASGLQVDLESDLMRLATGGSLVSRPRETTADDARS